MEKMIFLIISLSSLAHAQDSLLFSYLNQPYAHMVMRFSEADSFSTAADPQKITFQMQGGRMTFRFAAGLVADTRYRKTDSVKGACDTLYHKITDYLYENNFMQMYFYEDENTKMAIAYSRQGVGCRLGIDKTKNYYTFKFVLQNINGNPFDYLYEWPTDFLEEKE